MSEAFEKSVRRMAGRARRMVLFVEEDGGDWHARQLKEAMESHGAEVFVTTLNACAFDTRLPTGMDIPGFADRLPDGAFVRSISTGTLEQITLRLGILHALRESGTKVWNDARAIERCVDKSTATFFFQKAGLPVPVTRTAEGIESAQAFTEAHGGRCVLKPLFGSQGNGVRLMEGTGNLPPPEEVGNVYYTQRYMRRADETRFVDWRVFVSNGRMLAAMARVGKSWLTNIHQGAAATAVADIDAGVLSELAIAATGAIGADYAGVDLIADADGNLKVLEINSNPAWKGLQSITDVNIAWTLAEDFLAAVAETTRP